MCIYLRHMPQVSGAIFSNPHALDSTNGQCSEIGWSIKGLFTLCNSFHCCSSPPARSGEGRG